MNGNSLVYWDACIFLALIKNETRKDIKDMQGVKEFAGKIDKGEIGLVTSVITIPEVLESTLAKSSIDMFQEYLLRPELVLVDVNKRIANIAHGIRNYYQIQKQKDQIKTVAVPDAIHLATAISLNCAVFHTFDGDGGQKHGESRVLLSLNPKVAGAYNLIIEKPSPGLQPSLLDT
jgi:predicted nucleic acid-binding protein